MRYRIYDVHGGYLDSFEAVSFEEAHAIARLLGWEGRLWIHTTRRLSWWACLLQGKAPGAYAINPDEAVQDAWMSICKSRKVS